MKRYTIHRNIRKRALIFGMPVSSFAILMSSIIVSLLAIIFSFSVGLILVIVIWNSGLYSLLLRLPQLKLPSFSSTPKVLSNKQIGLSQYEDQY